MKISVIFAAIAIAVLSAGSALAAQKTSFEDWKKRQEEGFEEYKNPKKQETANEVKESAVEPKTDNSIVEKQETANEVKEPAVEPKTGNSIVDLNLVGAVWTHPDDGNDNISFTADRAIIKSGGRPTEFRYKDSSGELTENERVKKHYKIKITYEDGSANRYLYIEDDFKVLHYGYQLYTRLK